MSNYTLKTVFEGQELEVDLEVESWGSGPSWTDPGDPVEFCITAVWDADGEDARFDEDAKERLWQHIAENETLEPPDYDDDWFEPSS